jgi:hypothetical protein
VPRRIPPLCLTQNHEDPERRICRQHVPPGVRMSGGLAYARADALNDALNDALAEALAEALRLDRDLQRELQPATAHRRGRAPVVLRAAANRPATRGWW